MTNASSFAFPFDLVGFDLDGTMVDSTQDIAAAVNHALGLIDRPPLTTEQVDRIVGGGSLHLLKQALQATGGMDGLDVDALLAEQLAYYEAHIAVHTRPLDGLIACLDQLDQLGIRYAVATNKIERLARLLLGELGLLDRMAFIIGGDTLGFDRAKPAPDMLLAMMAETSAQRTAFVGDTIYDVKAAAAADCTSIIIAANEDGLRLGADHNITHFDQLIPLLKTL